MGSSAPRLRFAFAVLLAASFAHAEPTEDQKKTARNAMAEGRELRDEKNYKDAVEAFKKAHVIMNVPTTGIELAKTMELLGQLQEAKVLAAEVAQLPVQPHEPGPFAQARLDAQKLADDLELRIPTLKIKLKAPAGAKVEVKVGDAVVDPAVAVRRNPGKYKVTAKLGDDVKTSDVELREGELKDAVFEFKAKLAVAPPPPVAPPPAPPPAAAESKWSRPLVLGGFGVAAVGVVATGITGFLALSKAHSAKSSCDGTRCPPSTHSDIDSGKTMATIANISFAVAVVGAGVGVYGLMKPADEAAPSAAVVVGPGSVGLAGRF